VADLLLLTANPLEDIAHTRGIEAVILGGEVRARADLDELLRVVEGRIAQAGN
jgi:hypothetical protein